MVPGFPSRRRTRSLVRVDASEAVDELFVQTLLGGSDLTDFDPEDLPSIAVSATQGKFLHLLARATGAHRILELGTLAGYSAIWLARALSFEGTLVTVELDEQHARVAAANFERAGVADRIDQRVGPSLEVLPQLTGPYDFAFLDADKATMAQQLELVVPRMAVGGVIVCDNVVRRGNVVDPSPDDASSLGARAAIELLGTHPQLDATGLQTVGSKGYDGFAVALVGPPA